MDFLEEIRNYTTQDKKENKEKQIMLQYIEQYYDVIPYRSNMLFHMTVSSMIFNEQKDSVLMIYHKIYQSWTWTGGHADGERDLQKTALREAQEETGLYDLKMLKNGIASVDILTVEGHYKNNEYVCPHIHFNVTYCFIASQKSRLICNKNETEGIKWIPISDIKIYCNEQKMIPIYEKVIKRVL